MRGLVCAEEKRMRQVITITPLNICMEIILVEKNSKLDTLMRGLKLFIAKNVINKKYIKTYNSAIADL